MSGPLFGLPLIAKRCAGDEVDHILRNGSRIYVQNCVALFQASGILARLHPKNLMLGIQSCRIYIIIGI